MASEEVMPFDVGSRPKHDDFACGQIASELVGMVAAEPSEHRTRRRPTRQDLYRSGRFPAASDRVVAAPESRIRLLHDDWPNLVIPPLFARLRVPVRVRPLHRDPDLPE